MLIRHVTNSLTRYCDGELPAADVQRVEAHLAACADCRTALDEVRFSARVVRELRGISAPSSVWHGIDAALSSDARVPHVNLAARWAFAAVLLFAVAGTAYWWT